MRVTLHARHTALYRIFRRLGLGGPRDQVAFHRLDRAWASDCGLRRGDLLATLSEMTISGLITQTSGSEGAVIHLTDRGRLRLQMPLPLLHAVRGGDARETVLEALHTAITLFRARLRTRKAFRLSSTLVVDRRSRA